MLKSRTILESWREDELIEYFEKDDEVIIYIDEEILFRKIIEIKEHSIVVADVESVGDNEEISFLEIDYMEYQ